MTATINETAETTSSGGVGRIARVIGPVVDIEFPTDAMPPIYNALSVYSHDHPRGRPAHR